MGKLSGAGLAVLTGDLIDYTSLEPAQRAQAFDVLAEAAARLGSWPGAQGSSRLDRIRGDSWQLALTAPAFALRATLYLRASLRGAGAEFGTRRGGPPVLDTRIAIGLGPLSAFDRDGLSSADGPAFVSSGRALDKLPASRELGFATAIAPRAPEVPLLQASIGLCDAICGGWTDRQARTLQAMLHPEAGGQGDIAAALGIAQQTVSEHVRAAYGPAVLGMVDAFESYFNSQ